MIIDSSVFIASANKDDCDNLRAKKLLVNARNAGALTTDHIVDEVVTYLNRRFGSEIAHRIGNEILDSFEIVFFSGDKLREALELVKKYKTLSLCDALSVVAAKETRNKTICSFDSDFDVVQGVERISD